MLSLKTGLKDGINLHTSMFYLFASIETPFVFSYTQLLTLKWYFLEHVFGRYKSALFPGLCQSTLMNKHIAFSASISSNTRHKKSLQKVFLFPLVFMTLPNTLWFPSDSMCKPSQRVSGLFQHERNTFLQKKKRWQEPMMGFTFYIGLFESVRGSCWETQSVTEFTAGKCANQKWEIRNTNVQRIGWNRLWNGVLNREKGPKNAQKHWRAAASGTEITRSPVWDDTEEIRKTSHQWSKWNV